MIFDREDIAVLNRVMVRKGIETAAVSHNPGLTDAQRMMISGELARDISRCQLMIAVGMNDFSDIERQLESFEEDMSAMPPTLYTAYMGTMSADDSDDEGQYIWMLAALMSNTYLLRKGLELTHALSTAEHVLKPSEVRLTIAVRDEMRGIVGRCEALDGDAIGPLEYARAVADECSLLLRIDSGKEAGSREISDVMHRVSIVDGEEFERTFAMDIGPIHMEFVSMLVEPRGHYLSILCARCILNTFMERGRTLL